MTTTENPAPTLRTVDLYRIVGDLLEGLDVENVHFWTEYRALNPAIVLAGASAESLRVAHGMLDDPAVETSSIVESVVVVTVTGMYRGVETRVLHGCMNGEAELTRRLSGPELLAALADQIAADGSREG